MEAPSLCWSWTGFSVFARKRKESLSFAHTSAAEASGCCLPKAHTGFEPSRTKCQLVLLCGVQPLNAPAFETCGTAGMCQEPPSSILGGLTWPPHSWLWRAASCKHLPGHAHILLVYLRQTAGEALKCLAPTPQNPIGISP